MERRMNKTSTLIAGLAFIAITGTADTCIPSIPEDAALRALKSDRSRPVSERILKSLAAQRKSLISDPPIDIVSNKKITAPSGNPHDYVSFGPYWWPDPSKKDGKPYIRRDGEINPESRQYDDKKLGAMVSLVYRLSLLYYFNKDEEAASRAVLQLKAFFVDPQTKMNPNLRYGQGIPGRCTGRVTGIIDTINLILVADSIAMLSSSSALTPDVEKSLKGWFEQYAKWLSTDKMALKDKGLEQNHGLSYHAQIINYSLLAGDRKTAEDNISIVKGLIPKMVAPDGSLPLETIRTRSWHYSNYALEMLFYSIGAARNLGIDLLAKDSDTGIAVRKAVDYLMSYIGREKEWPYKEIEGIKLVKLTPFVMQMYYYTGEEKYLDALNKLPPLRLWDRRTALFFAP